MRQLKHNHGFTLVEMLAVIVLFSTITLICFSIITSATNQQIKQSTHNRDIDRLSYTLKVITKDIRKSDTIETILPSEIGESTDSSITYYKLTVENNVIATYWFENNEIIRSTPSHNESIATDISEFTINNGYISITTLNGQPIITDITLRSGKNETIN